MNIDVKHIAALAKLKIDQSEEEKWSEQMANIIAFADRLNELNLQEIQETEQHYTVFNVFRDDEKGPSYPREKILANAPEKEDGYYVVPKIVE
ncbi:MAG TPA: Asp-tRNA(Asn)/Glu-tRNA(Gln) amidotransferase subunit GatC [Clostridiales bacterium]|nr:Asp-tRNA(Asn)/Glu-tRNA(Gln) amidotransferase subunit GatC [Clostridiales bacterium]